MFDGTTISATAALALANSQAVGGAANVTSKVGASFAIDASATASTISGSTVAASGNTQNSAATGDTTANPVSPISLRVSMSNLRRKLSDGIRIKAWPQEGYVLERLPIAPDGRHAAQDASRVTLPWARR